MGFTVELHVELPKPQAADLGIDLGVVHAVSTSDGWFFDLYTERIRQLEVHQRKISLKLSARKKLARLGKTELFDRH